MKRQIRQGIFETNSSSVHSLTMCSAEDYEKWEKGELVYDRWNEELIPVTDDIKERISCNTDGRYYTEKDFNDYNKMPYETFYENFTSANGETVVAFGYYGENR